MLKSEDVLVRNQAEMAKIELERMETFTKAIIDAFYKWLEENK
jgi:hypothetical protein